MSDKRKVMGALPWVGGLNRQTHPMLVADNDLTQADEVDYGFDGLRRKRTDPVDLYTQIWDDAICPAPVAFNYESATDFWIPATTATPWVVVQGPLSVGDGAYFGFPDMEYDRFRIHVNVSTAGVFSADNTFEWQYLDVDGNWKEVTVTDGSDFFQNAGSQTIEFTTPSNWIPYATAGAGAPDGIDRLYVRMVCTVVGSTFTTDPEEADASLMTCDVIPFVDGIFDYRYSINGGKAQHVLIVAGGKVYDDAGDRVLVQRYSGLNPNSLLDFVVLNDLAIIASSDIANPPLKYKAVAHTVSLLGGPPPNFSYAVEHYSRIIVAGVPDFPSTIFASGTLAPEDWSGIDSFQFPITMDDGQAITGLARTHYGVLFVFKEESIHQITGHFATAADVARTTVSSTRGSISHHTIKNVGNDILFWSEQGCHSIATTQKFGDVLMQDVSAKIREAYAELVDIPAASTAHSVNYLEKDLYVTFFKAVGSRRVSVAFVFNYATGNWAIWELEAKSSAVVQGPLRKKEMYLGGYNGQARSYPGTQATTNMVIRSGGLVGENGLLVKNYEQIVVYLMSQGDWNAELEFEFVADKDGVANTQTATMSLKPTTGQVLGDFTLNQDKLSDNKEILVRELDIKGATGRSGLVTIKQETIGEGISVVGYVVRASIRGD